MIQYRISFAGAGNVAAALCRELFNKGCYILHIVSRSEENGHRLADMYNASWSSDMIFPDSTDIIIVAVPDHNLEDVLGKIKCRKGTIVAHTAGCIGLNIFPSDYNNFGILYPLQTFSISRKIDFKTIPFLIEASNDSTAKILKSIAETIGGSVHFSDTEHRRMLHLAAVFASNFSNYMFTIASDISVKAGFSFDLLKPLILETMTKAIEIGPENSQTGPAVRNDSDTMEKHLDLLSFSHELKEIYREISDSIINYYKSNYQNEQFQRRSGAD